MQYKSFIYKTIIKMVSHQISYLLILKHLPDIGKVKDLISNLYLNVHAST